MLPLPLSSEFSFPSLSLPLLLLRGSQVVLGSGERQTNPNDRFIPQILKIATHLQTEAMICFSLIGEVENPTESLTATSQVVH